ncbi:hypothetical protein NQ317_012500 [Molorchus minor]|uniref:Uncharacterized protein n=1 Tax=Molorchus minor TaxID=1323400 RepID=A0ABQ9K366_9CUCU|nr:hypothetical protein NQ317_012500 [Molorchus minor]
MCHVPYFFDFGFRSTPAFGETIKKLTNQLMDTSNSTVDMIFDTRTPPKVKQQVKLKEEMENSHAGVAIPVDEDALEIEESTKKMHFFKLERPTTNSGLSTWILLSGQGSTTVKTPTTRKPIVKPVTEDILKENITLIANDKPHRIVKPIFKKRLPTTTTLKSTTTVVTTATPVTTAIKTTTEPPKFTKIKASVLNNAVHKKNTTTPVTTKKPSTTQRPITTTITKIITPLNTTVTTNKLPAEAKEGELDLNNNTDGQKKKSTNKRKKNKPKRRKPSDKSSNSTSISKPTKAQKQNPVGTQLYNYLAREIMPTVGVGLVGLMVTAGLASYFLYPFGAARRTYEIDRKDKEGSYYYNDNYSNGIPEEEAIGKVIAGMPSKTLYPSKISATQNANQNPKYRLSDRKVQIRPQFYGDMVQGTVENVPNTNNHKSDSFEPITYPYDPPNIYSPSDDQRFVVGGVPKEVADDATPAAVPEHGPRNIRFRESPAYEPQPRSLKIRRKRSEISNEIENDINSMFDREETTTVVDQTTDGDMTTVMSSIETNSTTGAIPTTTVGLPDKVNSFIDLMKELIHYKAKLGLQIMQNITEGISKYIYRVQSRLDAHFRKQSKIDN